MPNFFISLEREVSEVFRELVEYRNTHGWKKFLLDWVSSCLFGFFVLLAVIFDALH